MKLHASPRYTSVIRENASRRWIAALWPYYEHSFEMEQLSAVLEEQLADLAGQQLPYVPHRWWFFWPFVFLSPNTIFALNHDRNRVGVYVLTGPSCLSFSYLISFQSKLMICPAAGNTSNSTLSAVTNLSPGFLVVYILIALVLFVCWYAAALVGGLSGFVGTSVLLCMFWSMNLVYLRIHLSEHYDFIRYALLAPAESASILAESDRNSTQ